MIDPASCHDPLLEKGEEDKKTEDDKETLPDGCEYKLEESKPKEQPKKGFFASIKDKAQNIAGKVKGVKIICE